MPLDENEWEILAARFVLGEVEAHEVRELANRLLNEGDEDPILIDIYVAEQDATIQELCPNLEKLLRGRVHFPDRENAGVDLVYRYAKRATTGRMEAIDAVGRIECIEGPFVWNDLILDLGLAFDTMANDWWNERGEPDWRLKAKPGQMPEDVCRRFVEDFESGDLRRWSR